MNNLIEDEIIDIVSVGEKETIDIQTNGNHLFFANDILTHNSVVKNNMTADELSEAVIADSFKKLMLSDFMIALINSPEERSQGKLNFKILKDREGQKDIVIPMRVDYPALRIFDEIQ